MPGPVPIQQAVEAEDTQFVLCDNNPNRRSIIIFNNTSEYLYLSYVAGISVDFFTIKVPPNWYGTMPWGGVYTGPLYGMLAAADVGAKIMVTELRG